MCERLQALAAVLPDAGEDYALLAEWCLLGVGVMNITPPPPSPPEDLRLAAVRAGFLVRPIAPATIDAVEDVRDGLTSPESASRRGLAPQAACNRYKAAEDLGLIFFIGTEQSTRRRVYGLTPEGKAALAARRPAPKA